MKLQITLLKQAQLLQNMINCCQSEKV